MQRRLHGGPRPHERVEHEFAAPAVQTDEMERQRRIFCGRMLAGRGDNLVDLAGSDDILDGIARIVPMAGRAWFFAGCGMRLILWVAGEAGIAKTTLIEHFIAGLGD